MIKSKRIQGIYGKVRVVEINGTRHYVKKINSTKTWIVSSSENLTLDSMVEIDGQFHFNTLKDLHYSLNK